MCITAYCLIIHLMLSNYCAKSTLQGFIVSVNGGIIYYKTVYCMSSEYFFFLQDITYRPSIIIER